MNDTRYFNEIFKNWLDEIMTRETKKLGRHLKLIQKKLIIDIEDSGKGLITCRPDE